MVNKDCHNPVCYIFNVHSYSQRAIGQICSLSGLNMIRYKLISAHVRQLMIGIYKKGNDKYSVTVEYCYTVMRGYADGIASTA